VARPNKQTKGRAKNHHAKERCVKIAADYDDERRRDHAGCSVDASSGRERIHPDSCGTAVISEPGLSDFLSDIAMKCSPSNILKRFGARPIGRITSFPDEADRRESFLSALIETSADCITVIDRRGDILYESPAMCETLGCAQGETQGTALASRLHHEDVPALTSTIKALLKSPSTPRIFAYRRRGACGDPLFFEGVAVNRLRDESVKGIVISSRNIGERKQFADALERSSLVDALTGLPNRVLFLERLVKALQTSRDDPRRRFAVLFLDLDRFKLINDSFGHSLGDKLLSEIGHRLSACIERPSAVARFGGDEFILLVEEKDDPAASIRAADCIHAELGRPFVIEGREVFTSAGIGIVRIGPEYADPDHVIRDADTAMHEAKAEGKKAGRGSSRMFHDRMRQRAVQRLALETDLRKALDRGEFELHYQPIVSLDSGKAAGLEALIRWKHPERGYIPPAEFIPVAEETGLILPIGDIVLMRACRELAEYNEAHPEERPLFVSVNFSARQFDNADAALRIQSVLEMTGLSPDRLKIEITESAIVENPDLAARTINAIKELGVRIAIDDFGTGYSSLSYLHRFSFDTLKIDRSFIMGLGAGGGKNDKIIRSVITLARDLEMSVVAEGIEARQQLSRLMDMRCGHGQGYLFARPMPFDEIAPRLDSLPEANRLLLNAGGVCQAEEAAEEDAFAAPGVSDFKCSTPVRRLAVKGLLASPCRSIRDIKSLLDGAAPMSNVVVLDGPKPVGLLMHYEMDRRLSSQYGLSLYSDREISRLMDRSPLIVDGETPIEEAAAMAMAREECKIYDEVIVVDDGAYAGSVSVRTMLDSMAKVHVEMAKGANPLTGLPGNVAIERELSRRAESGIATSVIYIDLDNFKVYNDAYGFRNGDKVILLAARTLGDVVRANGSGEDFIGHVGGDDFIVISDPSRAEGIGRGICDVFGERIGALYYEEDRERGYVTGKGRDGKEGRFPLVSVSIGVIDCSFAESFPMEEFSRRAAEVKKCAKALPGNSLFRDRRTPLGASE